MKNQILVLLMILLSSVTASYAGTEATISFPGAEGYGRFATGGRMIDGRGSKVYYVTRLDDCPNNNLVEGTFRWAVRSGDDTPRTVLFKVAGTVYLTSRLSCKRNITIAGQTAPGGGICIAGYQMKLTSNSIVRHIRFRAGDLPNKSMSQLDVENADNIIRLFKSNYEDGDDPEDLLTQIAYGLNLNEGDLLPASKTRIENEVRNYLMRY